MLDVVTAGTIKRSPQAVAYLLTASLSLKWLITTTGYNLSFILVPYWSLEDGEERTRLS